MKRISSPRTMQALALAWRRAGTRVAFVPTMGYLHDGHMSLVRAARRRVGDSGKVVVSIYVNPTQFSPSEDLSRYPRDLTRDLRLCRANGADLVFTPSDQAIYPGRDVGDHSTYVVEESLSRSMEGESRPTHFRGVTTIVAKLFNLVIPDIAIFGAKDWQQAAVIRRMTRDLNFPIRIVVERTMREPDGVAMSSRNVYLTPDERRHAVLLHACLTEARKLVRQRPSAAGIPVEQLASRVTGRIAAVAGARLDYVAFFHPETLQPARTVKRGTRMALAVYFGRTRLIDNGEV